jgi:hypothetical protein
MINNNKILYRFVDFKGSENYFVRCLRFFVINETSEFYYCISEEDKRIVENYPEYPLVKTYKVKKKAKSTHCYDTKEAAFKNYKKRKESQLKHCKRTLKRVETIISFLNSNKDSSLAQKNYFKIDYNDFDSIFTLLKNN